MGVGEGGGGTERAVVCEDGGVGGGGGREREQEFVISQSEDRCFKDWSVRRKARRQLI